MEFFFQSILVHRLKRHGVGGEGRGDIPRCHIAMRSLGVFGASSSLLSRCLEQYSMNIDSVFIFDHTETLLRYLSWAIYRSHARELEGVIFGYYSTVLCEDKI